MTTREVDVAIIGAGTAGLTARRAALANGAREVVLIEGGPYGTTCARVGCMPSEAADRGRGRRSPRAPYGRPLRCSRGGRRPVDRRRGGPATRVQSERDRFVGFVNKRAVDDFPREQGELLVGRASIAGRRRPCDVEPSKDGGDRGPSTARPS